MQMRRKKVWKFSVVFFCLYCTQLLPRSPVSTPSLLYCTLLYCTFYSTLLLFTLHCCTVRYATILYTTSTLLYSALLHSSVCYATVLYTMLWYCTLPLLCSAWLCSASLHPAHAQRTSFVAYNWKGWSMVNARLCKKGSLAFFFAGPRHFDFFNCKMETSKCFKHELKMFRHHL